MKRILSLLIAIAMLVVAVSLVACGNDPETTTTKKPDVTTSSSKGDSTTSTDNGGTTASSGMTDSNGTTASSGSTTEPGSSGDDLSGKTKHPDFMDVNFNGREFVFAIQKKGDWDEYPIAPEATGEDNIITEASINRTKTVESLYNCKIKEIQCDDTATGYSLISTDIQTGKHTIDFAEYQYSLGRANADLVNFAKLDIDLTHDWFDQSFIDTYNVNDDGVNRIFQLSGPWNLISYDASWMLYFNMTVYEALLAAGKTNVDLYQTVKDGKWTVDVMLGMMDATRNDVNGDQKMNYDDGDVFGLTTYGNGYMNNAIWFGIGGRGAIRDTATNKVVAVSKDTVDVAALSAAIDKASKLVNNEGYTAINSIAKARGSFTNGQTLFSSECLAAASLVDDENANFSCVPFPKYNEEQESYYTMVCNRAYGLAASAAISDLDNIASFIEVFAFHSQKLLYPEYVNYYKTQVFCDDGAGEMLDIVFKGRVWDMDYLGNMGITAAVAGYISTGKNMFSKAIASKSAATNGKLDDYRANVKKVAGK